MTKKKLTKNHSTSEEKRDKDVSHHNWRKIAELLRHSKTRSIERFLLSIDISEKIYYEAVNRLDYLKEEHERALIRIGCDREDYCWDEKLSNNSVIGSSLPQFLKRYRLDVEWRSQLKNQEEDKKQNITVIMEPFKKAE